MGLRGALPPCADVARGATWLREAARPGLPASTPPATRATPALARPSAPAPGYAAARPALPPPAAAHPLPLEEVTPPRRRRARLCQDAQATVDAAVCAVAGHTAAGYAAAGCAASEPVATEDAVAERATAEHAGVGSESTGAVAQGPAARAPAGGKFFAWVAGVEVIAPPPLAVSAFAFDFEFPRAATPPQGGRGAPAAPPSRQGVSTPAAIWGCGRGALGGRWGCGTALC